MATLRRVRGKEKGKGKPKKVEKQEPTTEHHDLPIVSIDWSTITGIIATLDESGVFKLWKFNTVAPENLFMHKDTHDSDKFKEAQRHLGINPNDSIDTRDLELVHDEKFDGIAKKVRITKDGRFVVILSNDRVHLIKGIFSEGDDTSFSADVQTLDLFQDVRDFYLDHQNDERCYFLRKSNQIFRCADISGINDESNFSRIRLLTDYKLGAGSTGGNDDDTKDDDGTKGADDELMNDDELQINKRPKDDSPDPIAVAAPSIMHAAIDPVGTLVAYSLDNGEIHIVDTDGRVDPQCISLKDIGISICSMIWNESGTYLVTGDTFGGIRFWKRTSSSMPQVESAAMVLVPRCLSNGGSYQTDTPDNLFSDQGMWNAATENNNGASHPNWAVFDFDRRVEIHEFGFQCSGDTTHDINEFRIEYSDYCDDDDRWESVGTFFGKAGSGQMQMFKMKERKAARYWRWYTVSRHSGWQGWIWNAEFRGILEDPNASDKRAICECFSNNSRHYSDVTFMAANGKLVVTGSTDRTANVWCVGTKESPEHPRFCSKIMLDAVIRCGTLNGRNMKVWNPGSNSILLAGEYGTIFCFSITDILLNQKPLLLKNQDLESALRAASAPKPPQISAKELRETERAQMHALQNWIGIWTENEFVLESITTIIKPIFMYLEKDKKRYISMLDSFVKSEQFGALKGILSGLEPLAEGPIRKQPTSDLLELYQLSADAHAHLQNFCIDIVNRPDVHATYAGNPGLKKHPRCAQKTVLKLFKRFGQDCLTSYDEKESLDYENLCDMGRAGICCRNVNHMVNALRCIEAAVDRQEIEILRIKNRFTESRNEGMGYRDIQFNVRFLYPDKVPTLKIVADSGHEGDNTSEKILAGNMYGFWCPPVTDNGEWVTFDFGQSVELTQFDFAHYSQGHAVETFNIETSDDVNDETSWTPVNAEVFRADVDTVEWQSFPFDRAYSSRYWRWSILSVDQGNTPVIWNVSFTYSLKSVAEWSMFGGVVVELQLHDENFFQIRKEAMGHKNYTASRFLVDFIDTAVDKLTIDKHNKARDDIILMVQKLLRGAVDE